MTGRKVIQVSPSTCRKYHRTGMKQVKFWKAGKDVIQLMQPEHQKVQKEEQ